MYTLPDLSAANVPTVNIPPYIDPTVLVMQGLALLLFMCVVVGLSILAIVKVHSGLKRLTSRRIITRIRA